MKRIIDMRPMLPDDERFVASSWFENYWKTVVFPTGLPFHVYKQAQDARIRKLLANADTHVVYATAIPDEILGYIVHAEDVLHWVYVKNAYRGEGIATALCSRPLKWYTHSAGPAGQKLLAKLELVYNPYLLENP